MKPLVQFICDTSHSLIEKPEDGWLEWVDDDTGIHSFRIVLNKPEYHQHTASRNAKGNHLNYFTGAENLPRLYKFLDPGSPTRMLIRRYPFECRLQIAEFTELLRRLTIPHYEEARLHFEQAAQDGLFDGANEIAFYMQDTLKIILHKYKKVACSL